MSHADADACRREIEALHVFFEGWFRGTIDATEAAFARFVDALADDFEIIPPSGTRVPRATLLVSVRDSHGSHPNTFEIDIRGVQSRSLADGQFLVVYEEWQRESAQTPWAARVSSAWLSRNPRAPGGFTWHHVHETARP